VDHTLHKPLSARYGTSIPAAVLLFGATLWGLAWMPLKHFAEQGVQGILLTAVVYGLAGTVALPILVSQRHAWLSQLRLVVLMGLLGGWANAAFVSALMTGEVVRVMLLFYLAPVWGVLGSWLLLSENVGTRRWVAVGFALAGAWTILGGGAFLRAPLQMADGLALSAGIAFGLNNVATRAAERVPVATKSIVVLIGCALIALLSLQASTSQIPSVSNHTWLLLIAFALSWVLVGTIATQYGVTHMPASKASVLLIFELLAAVASAVLIGGETPSPKEWIGGSLIAVAAFLEILSEREQGLA
jgi:drug/metabolite transporter (DMT)-like permease